MDGHLRNIPLTKVCLSISKSEIIFNDMGDLYIEFNPVYFFENKAWLELLIDIRASNGGEVISFHPPSCYSIKTSSSYGPENTPKLVEWCSISLSTPKPSIPLLLCNIFVCQVAMCDFLTTFIWKMHQLR